MDKRREDLSKLKAYTEGIDNELTMILQNLQWDRKRLLQKTLMATCRYDSNHKLPPDKVEEHEKECFLRQNGYTKDNQLLPDPFDPESNTLVKLSKQDIENIIGNASRSDPVFKKVYRITVEHSELQQLSEISDIGCRGAEPMSLDRLQEVYSADERRAIHDAVVSAVPSCHDLTDLALLSGDNEGTKKVLSRMEILLELRNMRRRRTKYRVAAKTRNYSDVLRDVIKTQMEHYTEGKSDQSQNENISDPNHDQHSHSESSISKYVSRGDVKYRYDHHQHRRERPVPIGKVEIKTEREDSTERSRDYGRKRPERRGDKYDRHLDRYRHNDRSRERGADEDIQRSHRSQDESGKRRHHKDHHKHKERTFEIGNEKSYEKKKGYDSDAGYNHESSSSKFHKHRDSQQEPGHREDRNYHHKEKERRYAEKGDITYRQKDRTERKYDDNKFRDRERSREEQDKSYEGRHGGRDDRTSRDHRSKHIKIESRERSEERSYETSYRDESIDSFSSQRSPKHKHYRYYDRPSEEFYVPNKKIKTEK